MKKYYITFLFICLTLILFGCSFSFHSKEVDPVSFMHDFQMKEDEKLFEKYKDGYLPITHTITIKREAPGKARRLQTDLSPSSHGYFEELYTDSDQIESNENMIYTDMISYRFSGAYKLSDQTAIGNGRKTIQFHELEREDFDETYPLSYRNKTYKNIETDEVLHTPLLFESLRQVASLPEPTKLGADNIGYMNLSENRWFELFGDDLPISYDEWIDASIVFMTDPGSPPHISFTIVDAQWYTEEFGEKVRYKMENKIYFKSTGGKSYTGLNAKELYEALFEDLTP